MKTELSIKKRLSIFTLGISFAIFIAFGCNIAYSAPKTQKPQIPHSAKKAAAKRLKAVFQKQYHQKISNWAKNHQGYTGLSRKGGA